MTVRISAMILLIVAGGLMFTGIFAANGGGRLIEAMTSNLGLGLTGTLVLFLFIVFLLGFVLDWTANVLICVPLFLPVLAAAGVDPIWFRSEEHTSELQSLMRISYAVFCLQKKKTQNKSNTKITYQPNA